MEGSWVSLNFDEKEPQMEQWKRKKILKKKKEERKRLQTSQQKKFSSKIPGLH